MWPSSRTPPVIASKTPADEDAVFLELFRAPRYHDISLNEWIARMPEKMAEAHLNLPLATLRSAPQTKKGLVSE